MDSTTSSTMHHAQEKSRAAALHAALDRLGLALRADSALCKCFLSGTLSSEYTAESVAQTCALHKFLYECTPYGHYSSTTVPYLIQTLTVPLGSHAAAVEYVKQYEVPMLKCMAIDAVGGIPPDNKWPWLSHDQRIILDNADEHARGHDLA